MKSVLNELFMKINEELDMGDQYNDLTDTYNGKYNKLLSALDGVQKDQLSALFEIGNLILHSGNFEFFKEGFRLGILTVNELNEK